MRRRKAPNYSAGAGEVITGNLARSASGQFASASGGSGAAAPAGGSRRAVSNAQRQAQADAEAAATREAKRGARESRRQQRLAERAARQTGRAGEREQAKRGRESARAAAIQAREGKRQAAQQERAAARAQATAAREGKRQQREAQGQARAGEREGRRQRRLAEREAQRAARAQARAERPGKAPARSEADKRADGQARVIRDMMNSDQGITPTSARDLVGFAGGKPIGAASAEEHERMGLLDKDTAGNYRLSPEGRRAVAAMGAGDLRGTLDAISRAGDQRSQAAARASERAAASTRRAERAAAVAQRRAEADARRAAREAARATKTFTVTKSAAGWRWSLLSSNAYRDRDNEIVSVKALGDDVRRADADGAYGPLLWWHEPGVVLGACDFNAMAGRVLVESGTFVSAAVGAAVASKADQMQASIGFSHPPGEPDAEGVFHHIQRFERSLVPAGRAANPLTALAVKETSPVDTNKIDALKALLGADAVREILAAAEATQQKADTAGTAYKAVPPAPAEVVIGGVTYTVKAPPIVETAMDMIEQPVEEAAVEVESEEDEDTMLTPREIDMIAEAVASKIVGMLDTVSAKMTAIDEEMKARGYARQKSDEAVAGMAAEVATLRRAVADLGGDQPIASPHRASAAVATVVSAERAKALGAETDGSTVAQVGASEDFFQFVTSGARRS